jgi:protein TonB
VKATPFEGVLAHEGFRPRLRKQASLTVSVGVHAAVLLAGIVYSLWYVEELSPPLMAVTLHLGAVPPPPPPPPPAKKHASTKPTTKSRDKRETLVQPKEQSKEESARTDEPDENDKEEEDGVAGGVEGGVKGGVIGGVVGGVLPSPQPKETGPKMLLQLPKGLLLIDPNADEYRVKLPRALERVGLKFTALLRICVSPQGTVTEVKVLQSADPAIDPQFPAVIGRWRYRPFIVDGRPIPFCYPVRYEVSAR